MMMEMESEKARFTVGRPRRSRLPSTESSCSNVAVWISSTTVAARTAMSGFCPPIRVTRGAGIGRWARGQEEDRGGPERAGICARALAAARGDRVPNLEKRRARRSERQQGRDAGRGALEPGAVPGAPGGGARAAAET